MTRRHGIWLAAVVVAGGIATQVRTVSAQPPSVNVAGNWTTQFAGAAANVSLTQNGPNVVGIYVNSPPLAPGALAGVMRGNVLTGRWTDASSSGAFTLTFSPDGRTFSGTWGRTITSVNSGGPWIGQRQ